MKARTIALRAIYEVNEQDAFSNLIINKLLTDSNLDKRDRNLVTHLVYGSIRRRNSLDWIINQVADREIINLTPWVRSALRLGVYQLDYLDRIPARAVCNETVEAAKRYCDSGAVKYVNGVLRSIIRCREELEFPVKEENPVQHLRYRYSQPQWMVERWRKNYGSKLTKQMCQTLNQIPSVVARTNNFQVSRKQLINNFSQESITASSLSPIEEAVELIDSPPVGQINSFQRGEFTVQGLSSMLAGHLLAPKPEERVVDLCSAPGGKTTHLAQLMQNQGKIYAVDKSDSRLELVEENCRRLRVDNVQTCCQDGRKFSLSQPVDKVLVDAPCSGLGVIANRPEIKWQKSPRDIKELASLQKELIANGLSLLRSGGELLYTVCTFTSEETTQVLEGLTDNYQVSLVDLSSSAADYGLEKFVVDKTIKILPITDRWEGFFLAKLIKH